MEIQVTALEAGWLITAARKSQTGQTYEGARVSRALVRHIRSAMPKDLRKIGVGGPTKPLVLSTDQLRFLHWQLAEGKHWEFDGWADELMDAFGELIDKMFDWTAQSEAKDTYDALPEKDRARIDAEAQKEKR